MEKGKEGVDVYCGPWVETLEGSFVEGVWDDDFEKQGFYKSASFFGSGGKAEGSGVKFCSPSHSIERLHMIRSREKAFISNSLAFVLEMSGCELDMDYLDYEEDFTTILKGVNSYKSRLPLKGSGYLELLYYCDISFDLELNMNKEKKAATEAFESYDHYYGSLVGALKRMSENGRSDYRAVKYGVVSTISKGYDSAACAALALEMGCDKALTLNSPKKYQDDDGTEIAKTLGYRGIVQKDADSYRTREDLVESEFMASGDLGTGIVFSSFEEECEGNIVLFGTYGDSFWGKDHDPDFVNCEMRDESSTILARSHYEHRLRVGFIDITVPFYGAENWPSLYAISNSEDMNPWSVGNDYDRPIPRRILEEKGVARDAFGMKKKGAGFNYRYDSLSRIRKRMAPKTYESFYSYYRQHKSAKRLIKNYRHVARFVYGVVPMYLNFALDKLNLNREIPIDTTKIPSNPFAPMYLFHWGVENTRERYRLEK